jgi:uncharacterized ion transporter superfamily protein YfcC
MIISNGRFLLLLLIGMIFVSWGRFGAIACTLLIEKTKNEPLSVSKTRVPIGRDGYTMITHPHDEREARRKQKETLEVLSVAKTISHRAMGIGVPIVLLGGFFSCVRRTGTARDSASGSSGVDFCETNAGPTAKN